MTQLSEADVIVVAHNPGAVLTRTLESIQASQGVRARITVVDNASTDGALDDAARVGANCLALDENLGYGGAFNVGLSETAAEWVACANQDLELMPATLATLVEAVQRYEAETGVRCIAGPALLTPTGGLAETCHEIPTLGKQIVALVAGDRAAGYRNAHPPGTERRPCGWLSAAFLVGRRSTFVAVGGFNPAYFMYVEDLEFFTRLRRAGFHCLWVPQASVVHLGGTSKVPAPETYASCLLNLRRYFVAEQGWLAGTTVMACAVGGTMARAGLWSGRSLGGDKQARARAAMFTRATMVALRRAAFEPSRSAAATARQADR